MQALPQDIHNVIGSFLCPGELLAFFCAIYPQNKHYRKVFNDIRGTNLQCSSIGHEDCWLCPWKTHSVFSHSSVIGSLDLLQFVLRVKCVEWDKWDAAAMIGSPNKSMFNYALQLGVPCCPDELLRAAVNHGRPDVLQFAHLLGGELRWFHLRFALEACKKNASAYACVHYLVQNDCPLDGQLLSHCPSISMLLHLLQLKCPWPTLDDVYSLAKKAAKSKRWRLEHPNPFELLVSLGLPLSVEVFEQGCLENLDLLVKLDCPVPQDIPYVGCSQQETVDYVRKMIEIGATRPAAPVGGDLVELDEDYFMELVNKGAPCKAFGYHQIEFYQRLYDSGHPIPLSAMIYIAVTCMEGSLIEWFERNQIDWLSKLKTESGLGSAGSMFTLDSLRMLDACGARSSAVRVYQVIYQKSLPCLRYIINCPESETFSNSFWMDILSLPQTPWFRAFDFIDGDYRMVNLILDSGFGTVHLLVHWMICTGRPQYLDMLPSVQFTEDDAVIAAKHGQLQSLMYLRKHGCPWNSDVCSAAVEYQSYDCLVYAHTNGCPLLTVTRSHSGESSGWQRCLDYAIMHGAVVVES